LNIEAEKIFAFTPQLIRLKCKIRCNAFSVKSETQQIF